MVIQLNKLLLLSLSMACIVFIGFSHDDDDSRHYCNEDDRPQNNECSNEEDSFESICAFYKDDCPFGICGQSVSNACEACADPHVLYYKTRDCKSEEQVNLCSETKCEEDSDEWKYFEPVCGICNDCNSGDGVRTFKNRCKACRNSLTYWYQPGICKPDRHYCDSNNDKCENSSDDKEVCAFLNSETGDHLDYKTFENACTACADSAVAYFIEGHCGPSREEVTPPTDSTCERDSNVDYDCDWTVYEPICGTYKEDGETRHVSLQNACVGCHSMPFLIDSYTTGLCHGDEGIRCEFDDSKVSWDISPVCGVLEEGCDDDSCRRTYPESRAACEDSSVVLYWPGMCPGDEGISCDPYRSRPPNYHEESDQEYSDVCGYYERECTHDSCRDSFDTHFDACSDDDVLFFTAGSCP